MADVHLPATLAAAAVARRGRHPAGGLILRRADLRSAVRRGREANTVLFCVDASGSMAARSRMAAVKGAVLSLLLDAYQRRDTVGLITFRGRAAELVLPPTGSVDVAARRLAELPTGGRTPLAAGLLRSAELIRTLRRRDPDRRPLLVVVTDGRATRALSGAGPVAGPVAGRVADPVADARRAADALAGDRVAAVVVDCENGPIRLGLARDLAGHLGAAYVTLGELSADGLAGLVRSAGSSAGLVRSAA
jgi:magnesium chelatase subunit D